jgi:hypothetical protein
VLLDAQRALVTFATPAAERIGSWPSDGIEPHAIGVAARDLQAD